MYCFSSMPGIPRLHNWIFGLALFVTVISFDGSCNNFNILRIDLVEWTVQENSIYRSGSCHFKLFRTNGIIQRKGNFLNFNSKVFLKATTTSIQIKFRIRENISAGIQQPIRRSIQGLLHLNHLDEDHPPILV